MQDPCVPEDIVVDAKLGDEEQILTAGALLVEPAASILLPAYTDKHGAVAAGKKRKHKHKKHKHKQKKGKKEGFDGNLSALELPDEAAEHSVPEGNALQTATVLETQPAKADELMPAGTELIRCLVT